MAVRVLVATGTRADFGLWTPVLDELERRTGEVEVRLLVMAMHLDARFGLTVREVRARGTPIAGEVQSTPEHDSPADMAVSVGRALVEAAPIVAAERPDWLLVLGDRGEQLAAALACLHEGIAVAHVQGGERTLGAVDDVVRDLISRIAHLHLVATHSAKDRLAQMGEAEWRIHRTGAPGLDGIAREGTESNADLRRRYGLPASGPYLLLLIHPETGAESEAPEVIAGAVLGALERQPLPVVAIWPNADAGGRSIAHRLTQSSAQFATLEPSIPRSDYLALLRGAAALVGNSSSGLIEAPLLSVPAVNVGRRQQGRERGDNVIDVLADIDLISRAIAQAIDPAFRSRLSGQSPYGDGRAAQRIVDVLLRTPRDDRLLVKGMP